MNKTYLSSRAAALSPEGHFIARSAFILLLLCCPMVLAAQNGNGVKVSNLSVDAGTVTFSVEWNRDAMPAGLVWSDTVWVFVDYNNNGVMTRLPLSAGATLTATSAEGVAAVIEVENNDQGVWVVGNARDAGAFSATVQLLTATAGVAGVCAYASNYPPVGEYTSTDDIKFTGTSPYTVVIKKNSEGTTETRTSDTPFTVPDGFTVQSFTDKTGAPGKLVPATYTLLGSNVCAGATVTLTLSGSHYGWRYQLYKGDTPVGAVVNGTGNALAFPDAPADAGGFSYMVRTVDNPAVTAQRAMQVSDVRAITVNLVPTITHVSTGGAASQSVYQHKAITAIVYTANNSATISRTAGSFPTGVIGAASSTSFTISGTPSVTGTFGYTLTAATVGGCTSTATAGTITSVAVAAPNYAASTKTWIVGTQIWSDAINDKACNKTTYSTPDYTTVDCRNNGSYGYLYSWAYVVNKASTLCPSPWRVPTRDDFCTLDKGLFGTSTCVTRSTTTQYTTYTGSAWGGKLGGLIREYNGFEWVGESAFYWSRDASPEDGGAYLLAFNKETVYPAASGYKNKGRQVRCVR
jgi:uncharacterized protein (TIGR02145 family)